MKELRVPVSSFAIAAIIPALGWFVWCALGWVGDGEGLCMFIF